MARDDIKTNVGNVQNISEKFASSLTTTSIPYFDEQLFRNGILKMITQII